MTKRRRRARLGTRRRARQEIAGATQRRATTKWRTLGYTAGPIQITSPPRAFRGRPEPAGMLRFDTLTFRGITYPINSISVGPPGGLGSFPSSYSGGGVLTVTEAQAIIDTDERLALARRVRGTSVAPLSYPADLVPICPNCGKPYSYPVCERNTAPGPRHYNFPADTVIDANPNRPEVTP
jgi:hypothetical protein